VRPGQEAREFPTERRAARAAPMNAPPAEPHLLRPSDRAVELLPLYAA